MGRRKWASYLVSLVKFLDISAFVGIRIIMVAVRSPAAGAGTHPEPDGFLLEDCKWKRKSISIMYNRINPEYGALRYYPKQ
jgi:hypothetical protein